MLMAEQKRKGGPSPRSGIVLRDGWRTPLVGTAPNLNDLTKEAIAFAVSKGWMLDRGDSVCLTDAGRDLIKNR
jgi:hypothetical protein